MFAVRQEDQLGCGIACVAYVLGMSYKDTRNLFIDGEHKATYKGFYCRDLVTVLKWKGKNYTHRYIKKNGVQERFNNLSIVFIKRSKQYPAGHFLVKTDCGWMDPYINYPEKEPKAGFRKDLPGVPMYVIEESNERK